MRLNLLLFGLIFIFSAGIGSAESRPVFSFLSDTQKKTLMTEKETPKKDSLSSGKKLSDMKEIGESKMNTLLYQHMYTDNLPSVKQ